MTRLWLLRARGAAAGLALMVLASMAAGVQSGGTIWSSRAEEVFAQGLEAYRKGGYQKARDQFEKLLELPLNQRSTAGWLMLGKTLFRMGEYRAALETSRKLRGDYPRSRYVPDAHLLAGDCYYMLGQYSGAVDQYGRLLAMAAPLHLQAQAAERLAAIVENGLVDSGKVEQIREAVGAKRLREELLFGRGRWYQRLGWERRSRQAVQAYLDSIPDGIFAGLAGRMLASIPPVGPGGEEPVSPGGEITGGPRREGGKARLGVLLPLSGPQRGIGEDLFAGIQLADEQAGEPFELVVADIGYDYGDIPVVEGAGSQLLRVARLTRQLVDQEQVLAVIGPIFSSDCVPAALIAESREVPLIAPLAQQSGLDSLGSHVFQLNVIPEMEGKALGEFAPLVLGLRHLAIIAPLTDYGWNFERAFARAVRANGGEVVYSDWYVPEETKDFKRIFEAIRRVGFELMPPPQDTLAVADTLEWTIPDSSAVEEGPSGSSFLNELLAGLEEEGGESGGEEEKVEGEAPPDSSEIFVDSIDGIAIVVENFEDAKTIAPQLHFHRLETQILGNDVWCDPEAIRQMRPVDRKYVEGAIMVAGYWEGTEAARKFTSTFRRRFARDPGYAAYGYDAAQLVAAGWKAGGRDPERLRDWLAGVRDFEGVSGRISFSRGRRTNSGLTFLKIDRKGRVRPLTSEDLPDLSLEEDDLPRGELDLPEFEFPPGETGGEE